MITIEEKLNLFSKHVFEDIKETQEEKLRKIEKHNKEQMEKHKKRIEKEKQEYAEEKIKRIKEKNDKKISRKKGQIKRDIMLRRNELFNEFINEIKNKVIEFTNSDEYKNYLKNSLDKGLGQLDNKNNIQVKISQKDVHYKEYIKEFANKNGFENVSIVEIEEEIIGGVILVDKKENIILDISLSEKFDENREYIGKLFYETLNKEGEDNGK